MKIFISHSSKDKWAARRISEDLGSLGCETFLDEKDIKTGNAIDVSIRENLKDCDDFLIILSPASIKSDWVLLELGGAMALEKEVIPILLYVGANEIPNVIGLRLARDINEIGQYYYELSEKLDSKPAVPKPKPKPKIKSKIKVGSIIQITGTVPVDYIREGESVMWSPSMEGYLGREAKVEEVVFPDVVKLDIDGGQWYWGTPWLTLKS
jgi:TIR domain